MPDLSVVIVNYKTPQLTLDCVRSVLHSPLALEIIVIDNASGDGSIEALQTLCTGAPNVRLIANTENMYFSAAYSQGVALAQSRYVVVLNSDMVVKGQTLVQLLSQMQSDSSIGAVTTTMFFPDGRLQRNGARHTPFWYLALNYSFLGKLPFLKARLRRTSDWLWYTDWDRTTPRDIDVLPGSCIIAEKNIWQAAGAFDAQMKMYFSDDYFSLCVKRLGKRTAYLVSDGIIHYEGASTNKRLSAWALAMYLHDLLVYTRLVFGRGAQILLYILLIPTWLVQRRKTR